MSEELKPCPPAVHRIKVWPQFIPSLQDGSKTFEARKDDRAFRVGDVLELYGWCPDTRTETGWAQRRTVTYKLSGPAWGVESGHCILGLSPLPVRPAAVSVSDELVEMACSAYDTATEVYATSIADSHGMRAALKAYESARVAHNA